MENVMKHIKNTFSVVAAIFVILILVVPYIFIIFYLRKNGQTLELYPKFRVKEINRSSDVNADDLNESVLHAEQIYKKIRGE